MTRFAQLAVRLAISDTNEASMPGTPVLMTPGIGGLIASLPLISLFGMIWLWRDTHDPVCMAAHETGRSGS